ncbi:GntR family transcriptional regulator [Marinimicrococcus flavescens]|uniref:GntR family transcriptional regulator n=1 Tax=Marinimicrococcus flavescens TaxID=3031815 RepID=A0AAP3V0F3_9PROT|nr:GntR family transcriptional regulator [Marinimicrococcus flavescens]
MSSSETAAAGRGSLGEALYRDLADALMKGALRPDERLKIRELARQAGTSVTPVRDAILRLVQNGALAMRSPRDIRVPVLARDQYLEIRQIRLHLEGLAAEAAARAADAADIERLAAVIAENELAFAEHRLDRAIALNQVFHFELAAIARMPILGEILRNLWLKMGPVIAAAYEAGGRTMIEHHGHVLDAIRRRDPAAARKAIRLDIKSGGDVILRTGILFEPR